MFEPPCIPGHQLIHCNHDDENWCETSVEPPSWSPLRTPTSGPRSNGSLWRLVLSEGGYEGRNILYHA